MAPVRTESAAPRAASQKLLLEFITSGASVTVATACTHPIDVVKVQQQMQAVGVRSGAKSMLQTAKDLLRESGPSGLYRGIQPALLRSATYGCLRLGLYGPFKDQLLVLFPPATQVGRPDGDAQVGPPSPPKPTVVHKLVAGILSGGTATAITNPFEIAKVRLQLTSSGPRDEVSKGSRVGSRGGGGGFFGEVLAIARKEGIGALWKGVGPGMARAAALTASQVATYDECKQMLMQRLSLREGILLHLGASMMAGVVSTAVTSPFDTVKSRMMAPTPVSTRPSSAAPQGSIACATMIIRREGVLGLYKGWAANYSRLAPQTVITFMVYEQLRKIAGIPSL